MRQPNFFLVGAPKCGTSSMNSYLGQHPEIFMARKEPHYFASDLEWEAGFGGIKDLGEYLSIFDAAGDEPVVGEASVFYLYSRTAAERIRAFCPTAKILCMLRNPVDAIRSFFHMNVANGSESILDIRTALAAEPLRLAGENIPSRVLIDCNVFYTRVASYADQVTRYIQAFPPEALHFVLFDDFVGDPRRSFAGVLEHLEVDPTFEPDFEVVNAARRIRNVGVRQFLRSRPALGKFLHRHVPPSWRRRAGDVVEAISEEKNPPPQIDVDLRSRLLQQLRPDIERLATLIQRDLSAWVG